MFNSETARLAGQKSKRRPTIFTKTFCDIVDPSEAERLVLKLVEEANKGNIKALELCVAYILGKPNQNFDITSLGEQINSTAYFILPDGTKIPI